jgi:hypothetical protein
VRQARSKRRDSRLHACCAAHIPVVEAELTSGPFPAGARPSRRARRTSTTMKVSPRQRFPAVTRSSVCFVQESDAGEPGYPDFLGLRERIDLSQEGSVHDTRRCRSRRDPDPVTGAPVKVNVWPGRPAYRERRFHRSTICSRPESIRRLERHNDAVSFEARPGPPRGEVERCWPPSPSPAPRGLVARGSRDGEIVTHRRNGIPRDRHGGASRPRCR